MKIAVLGGGISGLSAGFYAKKRYPKAKIELYEKTDRLGGWIESTEKGPFLFERGPRTFQASRSYYLLELISALGLSDKLLFSTSHSKRYVWIDGKMRSLGSFWHVIAAGMIQDLLVKKGGGIEESIDSFFTRRFGQNFVQKLIDPVVTGIFGGDPKKLSMQACFPKLAEMEQKGRSVVFQGLKSGLKANMSLFTLQGGMQSLIDPLAKTFDHIYYNHPVSNMPKADLIISALPSQEIALLLQIDFSVRLEEFHVVNLGFLKDGLLKSGYGYLVPSSEKESVMGMIWDSSIFPVNGQTKITVMTRSKKAANDALFAIKKHLNISHDPQEILIKKALIPQYDLGHMERVSRFQAEAKKKFPQLILVGNWLEGASVDDCIKVSKQTVLKTEEALVKSL